MKLAVEFLIFEFYDSLSLSVCLFEDFAEHFLMMFYI